MLGEEEYVCKHMQLTKEDLVKVIREKNITTFAKLQDETDVATVCGGCKSAVIKILEDEIDKNALF